MKVLLVNGSARERDLCREALDLAAEKLQEAGLETEIFWPIRSDRGDCTGCGACHGSGVCVYDRRFADFAAQAKDCDAFVFAAPAGLLGLESTMQAFLERALAPRPGRPNAFAGKCAAALIMPRRGMGTAAENNMTRLLQRSGLLTPGLPGEGIVRELDEETRVRLGAMAETLAHQISEQG